MRFRAAPLLAVMLFAACGGGGGGSAHVPHPAASPTGAASSSNGKANSVTLELKIPKRATLQSLARARTRVPKWVSASTEGAAVTVDVTTPGGVQAVTKDFNLIPGGASPSPNGFPNATCAADSDGSTTCTMVAPIPALGSNLTVNVILYDAPPQFNSANEVATGTVATTTSVTEGASIVLPLVLSGVVSTVEAAVLADIPATGGTGSFLLQGLDADGNIILASDGADGPDNAPATFNLSVPPSINATLTDTTTAAAGSGVATLNNAQLGDTIAVIAPGSPAFVGLPIEAIISDKSTAAIGTVYEPVTPAVTSPVNVLATPMPNARIAGAQALSNFGAATANGFVLAFNDETNSSAASVFAYTVSGSTASKGGGFFLDPNSRFPGAIINDLTTTGNVNIGNTSATVYVGETSTSSGNDGNELLTATIGSGTTDVGAPGFLNVTGLNGGSLANGQYTLAGTEDAGGYIGSAIASSLSGIYTNNTSESNAAIGGSYYSVAAAPLSPISIAATLNGTSASGQNPIFILLSASSLLVTTPYTTTVATVPLPQTVGTPVSLVASGPFVHVLTNSGAIISCTLGTAPACSAEANVVSSPSTDRHAMALGPDGALWVATSSGIERYDPSIATVTGSYGGSSYTQVVASADGRLYATDGFTLVVAIP